jgi:ribosomal protein S18 acetylase RimI-like enzyme
MTSIAVRALEVQEWPLYRSVRLAALADSPAAFGSTLSREQAFTTQIWQERLTRRNQFIAEDDGQTCGYIGIVPLDPDVAEVVGMWVHPAARGRGVGDLLLLAALRWAPEHGHRKVDLWVAEGNHHAERLYARHGFQRTGAIQPILGRENERQFAMTHSTPGSDVTSSPVI